MLFDLAQSNVSLTAGRGEPGAGSLGMRVERVVGRDVSCEGLVIPEGVLRLVEQERAIASLSEYRSLAPNWDGYGALPVSPEAIGNSEKALFLLLRYASAPDVTPNPNGTVGLEWISERGEAHIEIGKTRFSFFAKPRGGQPVLADGLVGAITEELGSLIGAIVCPEVGSLTAVTKAIYTAGHERTVG